MYDSQSNGRVYDAPIDTGPGRGIFAGVAEGERILPTAEILRVIRRRIWIIVAVTVVLTGAIVAFSLLQTPMYQASIKILVGQQSGITENPSLVGGLEQLTRTVTEGVNSRPVAQGVIQELGLETTPQSFLNRLEAQQVPDTQFIEVNYRDSSPERAQQIANTTGDVFSEQISRVNPNASALTATVWERAQLPEQPVSPNPLRDGLVAMALGLMLGTGLAFLVERLDDSWNSPEEAEQISGVPTFGVIPNFESLVGKKKGY